MKLTIQNSTFLLLIFIAALTITSILPIFNGQNFYHNIKAFIIGDEYNPLALVLIAIWPMIFIKLYFVAISTIKTPSRIVSTSPFYNIATLRTDLLTPISGLTFNKQSELVIDSSLWLPELPVSTPEKDGQPTLTEKYINQGDNKRPIKEPIQPNPPPATAIGTIDKEQSTPTNKNKLATVNTGIKVAGESWITPDKKSLLVDRLKKQKATKTDQ